MSDTSAVLALPYIQAAQAQKHVTHNEALAVLDVLVQAVVADRDRTAPPADPAPGARHIVGAGATGEWAGQDGRIAVREASAWTFLAPQAGWAARVLAEDRAVVVHDGSAWALEAGTSPDPTLNTLGLNTSADATNRLALSAAATLLSHEGAGHQVKVNKAADTDTASLLFQSNWSGRAEMGLAGNDDFTVKLSADGAAWVDALRLAADGTVSGTAVQSGPGDMTPGKLALAQYAGPVIADLVGPITQTGGVPEGAVIEQGSTADGHYTRLADGTQICWHTLAAAPCDQAVGATGFSHAAVTAWTLPAAFVDAGYQVSLSAQTGAAGDIGFAFEAPGRSATTVEVGRAGPAGTSLAVGVLAVGRWY